METRTIPEGLTVFREGNGVVIRRRWKVSFGLIFFAVITGLNVWMRYWASQGRGEGPDIGLMALEVAPALMSVYFVLCSLVNRTDVIITGSKVRTVSTPLPWWGDRTVLVVDIRAVRVREGKAGEDGAKFRLMYIDRAGKEQVEFIGRAMRDILGVEELEGGKETFFPLHRKRYGFKKTPPAGEPVGNAPSENDATASRSEKEGENAG